MATETDWEDHEVRFAQMAEVAPETVEAPHHEGVTGPEVVEDGFELGAVVEGARSFVRPYPCTAGPFSRRRSVGGPSAGSY